MHTSPAASSSAAGAGADDDWRKRIVTSDAEAIALAGSFKVVAVLGIKTERHSDQPAFYVAQALQSAGVEVIPVPVYYPDVTAILGRPVVRSVAAAAAAAGGPGRVDCVDVFRRPQDVEGHVQDILSARPRCVWLQSGIRCPPAEEAWARAGITVVADKCLMVLHRAAQVGEGARL
ncbi:hypothetical protein HYH03_010499 [Edaphochlamys debaryana]|uniref:CoA-binding domain-containing protein n=1 Tax=Edaphochlamys debaryana TaxID=47281 RepID=A0A836BXB7_9CHLO|nr:hypothetical protein HYH03_010499 [Edaphochlamys debaryana]|eukprot:KAG2491053.1 hypothetical protein HYH03_010499 [Edaphochlamys debaryana]